MQHDDTTIKQSGRDKMRQGARYNDEARRDDVNTQHEMDDKRRDTRNDMARRRDGTGHDGTRWDAATRGRETTHQTTKGTNERMNKH